MRILISVFILSLLAACSTTGFSKYSNIVGPFTVVGQGPTQEAARQDGFKKAIEYSMGVAIQSEKIIQNNNLDKNYILSHSSGYIDQFKINKVTENSGRVEVEMEVFVKPTYLDDYVIKSSDKNFRIEGQHLKEGINTFQAERASGDDLLMSVLKDYPTKSFDFQSEPVVFKVDGDRVLYAEFKYTLKWSDAYLRSLAQTLKMVSDSDCKMFCDNLAFYKVSYKKNQGDLLNTNDTIYFKDNTRPKLVYKYLRGAHFPAVYSKSQQKHANVRYVIRIDFADANRTILNTSCYYPDSARKQDYWEGEQFFIDNKPIVAETVKIYIKRNNWYSDHYKNLERYNTITVKVTRPDMCQDL
jgi:hypothetical protein